MTDGAAGPQEARRRWRLAGLVGWPARRDSNPRPSVPKTDALSTELRAGGGGKPRPRRAATLVWYGNGAGRDSAGPAWAR